MHQTINCAHRGASAHAPENTLAALELALEMGATMAEVDLQPSAEGHLVLCHDDTLERTTDGRGFVWQHTLAQIKDLDAGSWFSAGFAGERIPTLQEVGRAMAGLLSMNLELKIQGQREDYLAGLQKELRAMPPGLDFFVTSFDHQLILDLRPLLPELKTGLIVGRGKWQPSLMQSPVQVLSLERSLVTPELLAEARAAELQIHVWTVNSEAEIRQFLKWGADAIISNYPDRVAACQTMD